MLLITILVLVLLFIFVQVVGHAMRKSQPPALRHFFSQVHGIVHENEDGSSRQSIIRRCHVGEELVLIPEPTNRYDHDAIKVCRRDGEQLGYWKGCDGRMARELSNSKKFRVTIDEIYPFEEDRKKHGVRLRVDVLS